MGWGGWCYCGGSGIVVVVATAEVAAVWVVAKMLLLCHALCFVLRCLLQSGWRLGHGLCPKNLRTHAALPNLKPRKPKHSFLLVVQSQGQP